MAHSDRFGEAEPRSSVVAPALGNKPDLEVASRPTAVVARPKIEYSVKLEALRGLAALMVVGHHVFPTVTYPWMHIPFNGRAAVSLFFVLSGYVLGLSLRRGQGTLIWQYFSFVLRRILRIYPVYFVATVAFVLYWKIYPFAGGQGPLVHLANLQLTSFQLIKNFLFLDQSINIVTWSLKVEMVGSLALPIMHFLSNRRSWTFRATLLVSLILLALTASGGPIRQCLFMFYLGYLLIDLETIFPKLTAHAYTLFTTTCIAMFLNARFLGETGLGSRIGLIVEAACAAGLILGIQAGGGSLWGVLDRPWTHFAGRVSYSVFLVHLLVEDILIGLMMLSPLRMMPEHGLSYLFLWLGLCLSVPVVLLVAGRLYRWIELPFIRIGKAFGSARPYPSRWFA